jgi:hypothetical protein
MLVKELRQGMRARGFTILFLGFQILLSFILLTSGSSFESDSAGAAASGIIFTMFSIAVLGIQPMRAAGALSTEITGKTIEMMVLTRLSARRIVFGKWIAIVSQSALLLTTIIPYLILRYFFGGMILLGEIVFLALIFLTSMAFTAVMVGFSATSSKLARVLPIVAFVMLANGLSFSSLGRGLNSGMSYFTLSDWDSRVAIFCYLVFIAYLGWCALSSGISVIAPAAENHSTIRRIVALALTVAALGAGFHDDFEIGLILMFLGIVLTPAFVTALTEPAVILPPVCKPFLKRGVLGKTAAIFLLPGWPTGVFYTFLLTVASIAGITLIAGIRTLNLDEEMIVSILAFLGTGLLPALLAAHFTKEEGKRFTNFMLFLVGSVIVMVTAMMVASINNMEGILWIFVWNPPVIFGMLATNHFDSDDLLLVISVVDAILFGFLIVAALKAFRDYQRVFQETSDGIAGETALDEPVIADT